MQMGRRGRDMEMCREVQRPRDMEQVVPHPRVVDNIGRDTSGARDPSPTPDHPAQGSSARKIKSP